MISQTNLPPFARDSSMSTIYKGLQRDKESQPRSNMESIDNRNIGEVNVRPAMRKIENKPTS